MTTPTGWSASIPSGTDPVYYSQFVFSIVGDTGIVNGGTWSSPVVTAENGTDGLSTFRFNIYRRATSQPSAPTGGSYNFTTNAIVSPTDWYSAPPSGTDPMWVSTGTAQIAGATGTDSSITWSTVNLFVSNGAAGDDGPRNANGYIYFPTAQANAPAQPGTTGNYSFSSLTFANLTNGWVHEPPEYVAGSNNTFWAASYTVTEATFNGTQTKSFSAPYKAINFNGLVTFTNLNNELADPDSTEITTIDGGLIKTGVVDASRLRIDNVGIDTFTSQGQTFLKIGDDGVTTVKIDDLAVTGAKIDNLAVGTIKIQDQAVTIPSGAYTAGNFYSSQFYDSNFIDRQNVQSVTFTQTAGISTEIFWSFFGFVRSGDSDAGDLGFGRIYVRILRGSTVVIDYGDIWTIEFDDQTKTGMVNGSLVHVPTSSGSVTYHLEIGRQGDQVQVSRRSLITTELKK